MFISLLDLVRSFVRMQAEEKSAAGIGYTFPLSVYEFPVVAFMVIFVWIGAYEWI